MLSFLRELSHRKNAKRLYKTIYREPLLCQQTATPQHCCVLFRPPQKGGRGISTWGLAVFEFIEGEKTSLKEQLFCLGVPCAIEAAELMAQSNLMPGTCPRL